MPIPSLSPRAPALAGAAAVLLLAACGPAPGPAVPAPAALPALEAALAREPGDAQAAVRLASGYRAAGRLDDARVVLEQARANSPRHRSVVLLLGAVLEEQGRLAEARALYLSARDAGVLDRARADGRLALLSRLELRAAAKEAVAREATLAGTAPSPRTVAVFPFLFSGTDESLRPLERALAEMLTTDLAQTDRLTVVERARVQALLDEIRLGESGLAQADGAARPGRLLGAGTVVQGRVTAAGEAVTLEALVVRVGAPGDAPSLRRDAALRRLLDAEKELALGVYEAMGVTLSAAERERVSRRPTENVQALLAFGIGLQAEDAGDFAGAARAFRRAAALDPSFGAARQRAAEAGAVASAASSSSDEQAREALASAEVPVPALSIEEVANVPVKRDPASEALGGEGLGRVRTAIQIIIRRP